MTVAMEELVEALFLDQVPDAWSRRAYPSTHGLTAWYSDLLLRAKELEGWVSDFTVRLRSKVRLVSGSRTLR